MPYKQMKGVFMKIKILCSMLAVLFFTAGCATSMVGGHRVSADGGNSVIAGNAVEVIELSKTVSSWDGGILPAFPEGQPEITILRITVPPGVSLPEHKHPVINAGVLLRGELRACQSIRLTFARGDFGARQGVKSAA